MPSAKYQEVYAKTREIKSGPSNDEQLDLYGWAKIVEGKDIESQPKPGMFDIKGKKTRERWQKFVDEGVTPEQAEKNYIELAEKLIAQYGS
ncbi:hypothetical protein BU24DRAFT_459067 [Aaosphaeria arxii CBS 175.79]|uniref:ACB domain-containing protein n=1 Tax=Aaosphaeria arxii CBS 175.79 TaxID=1450172 RepID=A0A6A5Y1N9_9PLEO|nr:uncharacterized protein BU24DRAFT_459067 [Aaosphaeria arxii CBS 175.79]KAF2019392.1 hypothetical protein BU24DRAFT_459067 [Aaosphaeria arxii CBS 175.79]